MFHVSVLTITVHLVTSVLCYSEDFICNEIDKVDISSPTTGEFLFLQATSFNRFNPSIPCGIISNDGCDCSAIYGISDGQHKAVYTVFNPESNISIEYSVAGHFSLLVSNSIFFIYNYGTKGNIFKGIMLQQTERYQVEYLSCSEIPEVDVSPHDPIIVIRSTELQMDETEIMEVIEKIKTSGIQFGNIVKSPNKNCPPLPPPPIKAISQTPHTASDSFNPFSAKSNQPFDNVKRTMIKNVNNHLAKAVLNEN